MRNSFEKGELGVRGGHVQLTKQGLLESAAAAAVPRQAPGESSMDGPASNARLRGAAAPGEALLSSGILVSARWPAELIGNVVAPPGLGAAVS